MRFTATKTKWFTLKMSQSYTIWWPEIVFLLTKLHQILKIATMSGLLIKSRTRAPHLQHPPSKGTVKLRHSKFSHSVLAKGRKINIQQYTQYTHSSKPYLNTRGVSFIKSALGKDTPQQPFSSAAIAREVIIVFSTLLLLFLWMLVWWVRAVNWRWWYEPKEGFAHVS